MLPFRHTKIVATLGPATDLPGQIEMLLSAGLDCVRINCSYGGAEDWQRRVEDLRATARHQVHPIPVIFDLQGLKMRLAPETPEMTLAAGTHLRFYGADSELPEGEEHAVRVDRPGFVDLVGDGCELVIGDGTPRLAALARDGDAVIASVTSPGTLSAGKGVTVTNVQTEGASFTEKDERDLVDAVRLNAEFVAVSYVRSAADVEPVKQRLAEAGSRARVIAKIEQRQAYENLDEIIATADGVMVARGDLGVVVGHEQVPLMQKDIIRRATQAGKLVITATQMLESMINSPVPTRAEAADVANAVIDGTSAVMLSAETSTGAYPVETVTKMGSIAAAAESEEIRGARDEGPEQSADAAVMHAALYLSHATDAQALIVPTTTGNTARAVAKYRPRKPIIAIADDAYVAAQLNAEWGVMAAPYEEQPGAKDRTQSLLMQAKQMADLDGGARVVLTGGPLAGKAGATNVIALRELP